MEKLYTVKEASQNFGMSVSLYRKAIRLRQIEFVKVGKAVRLTESAIKEYFDNHTSTISVAK
ncbi:helix-turn-helix domain-containing protein [Sulfurovum sp. CS9]|uniref:helix-turn-helix domain-containing protein n=1 Tax=Sulfurovum sp. CS9 TaxID=3391146 RepID=UPI0039E8193F